MNGEKKTFWQHLAGPFEKIHVFFNGDSKGLTHFTDPEMAFNKKPRRWLLNLLFVAVLVIVLCFMGRDIAILDCFDRPIQWETIGHDIAKFFSPDWDYFWGKNSYATSEGVVYNCLLTFSITFVSTLISFIVSIPFGVLASHKLFGKKAVFVEIILILIRTMPELLLALFLIRLCEMTTMAAIVCLSFHSIGMIGKLFADQIDESDLDSLEALDACGANKLQRINLAVMPEVFPSFISVGLYRLDINIRTATTLGVIIQQKAGIGFNLWLDFEKMSYPRLGADTLGVVVMIILVDLLSSWLRKKLV